MTNHSDPKPDARKTGYKKRDTVNHPFRRQNSQLKGYSQKAKHLKKKEKYS